MKVLFTSSTKYNIFFGLVVITCILFSCRKSDSVNAPVLGPATIASVTGPTGLTSGPKNTIITITGTNFITDLTKIQVKVNGKLCTVLSATATSIQATIPPDCGTGIVELFLNGTRYVGSVFNFVYTYTLSSVTNGQVGYLDGPIAAAQLEEIVGIAIDGSDNIYTAQYTKPRVRKISPNGFVSTMAGDGTIGAIAGVGTGAKLGQFDFITSDAAGTLLIAESNNGTISNYVRRIDINKNVGFMAGYAEALEGIKVMPNGNIYITANDRIGILNYTTGVQSWLAISSNGVGDLDGPIGTAKFSLYGGIEVSPDETKIYVSDFYNGTGSGNKVKLFDRTTNSITTIAGKTGLSSGDGSALNVGFKLITCTLLDNNGGLYIADGFNSAIKYLKNGTVTTFLGSAGSGDVDGDIYVAKIDYPHGMVWDSNGDMFISCTGNNKLKKLTID